MEHEKMYGDLVSLKKELIAFKNNQNLKNGQAFDNNMLIQCLHLLPFHFFYLVDLSENKIIHEKGLTKYFGFEIKEKAYDEFFDLLHPEDLPALAYIERELIHSKGVNNDEWRNANLIANCRIKNTTGCYSLISRTSSILEVDEEGRPKIILHLCNDLSNLVQENAVSYVLNVPGEREKRKVSKKGNLTKRETQILRLIAQGKSSSEIGDELYISRETVDKHRKNMIKKTGCMDTHKLAIKALNEKWI